MMTIESLTLYDLMAEDLDIWVKPNSQFGFDIEIDNREFHPLIDEKGIHPFAAESFADFCRRYLVSYEKALNTGEHSGKF